MFFSSLLTSSTGNCAEDVDTLLAIFSTKSVKQSKQSSLSYSNPRPNTLSIGPTDYREPNVSTSIIQANAIAYVSGYLLNKCFKIHSCAKCNEALTSANLEDNRKLLCLFKSYSQEGFGGLNVPSSCYLEYIMHLEDHFVKHCTVTTKLQKVGESILKILKSTPVPFQSCPEFPLEFLLKLFLRMRIYYSIKFANREFSSNKKSRKYIKVTHLWSQWQFLKGQIKTEIKNKQTNIYIYYKHKFLEVTEVNGYIGSAIH